MGLRHMCSLQASCSTCASKYTPTPFSPGFKFSRISLPFTSTDLSTATLQGALCLHVGTKSPSVSNGQSQVWVSAPAPQPTQEADHSSLRHWRKTLGILLGDSISPSAHCLPPADAYNFPPTQQAPLPGTEVTPQPPLSTPPRTGPGLYLDARFLFSGLS